MFTPRFKRWGNGYRDFSCITGSLYFLTMCCMFHSMHIHISMKNYRPTINYFPQPLTSNEQRHFYVSYFCLFSTMLHGKMANFLKFIVKLDKFSEYGYFLRTDCILGYNNKNKYFLKKENSILCAWVHNEGYYATSDNARRRSKPRRSRGVAEAKPRRSRSAISPASILSESRNYPNCVHRHIFYFMWLRRIYEF